MNASIQNAAIAASIDKCPGRRIQQLYDTHTSVHQRLKETPRIEVRIEKSVVISTIKNLDNAP